MLSQVVQCTSDSVGAELRFLVKLHLLPRSMEKRSQNSSAIVNIQNNFINRLGHHPDGGHKWEHICPIIHLLSIPQVLHFNFEHGAHSLVKKEWGLLQILRLLLGLLHIEKHY